MGPPFIPEGDKANNVIPGSSPLSRVECCVRSSTLGEIVAFTERVRDCLRGSVIGTGCVTELKEVCMGLS